MGTPFLIYVFHLTISCQEPVIFINRWMPVNVIETAWLFCGEPSSHHTTCSYVFTAENSASWLSGSYHGSVLRLKISRSPLSLPFTSRSSKRVFSKSLPVRIRHVAFVTLVFGYSLSSTKSSVFLARFILISHFFSHRPKGMFTRIFFLQICNVFPFIQ